jgi:hypothetical protein
MQAFPSFRERPQDMDDTEKLYTKRDLILAKRLAYAEAHVLGMLASARFMGTLAEANEAANRYVRNKYPLPKVERPRVVQDPKYPDVQWRSVGGLLEVMQRVDPGFRPVRADFEAWTFSYERLAVWSDLLANPTEFVDEDTLSSSSKPETEGA